MTRLSSRLREYERICYETYQVVGTLANDCNRFCEDSVNKVLDNLSLQKIVHDDILPFESKVNLPSEKEIEEAKKSLEAIKGSFPVEYYQNLKKILDYF
jgi:hypothetical protein